MDDNTMADITTQARDFATKAHTSIDQRRKYTGDPYIKHPAKVAMMVGLADGSDDMIAAAWLHDVVEDTPATLDEIEDQFGPSVARLVDELTDKSRPEDGNRAARKAIDRARLAAASAEAQTIKLADLIDNTSSIAENDPEFARVYLAEKLLLLEVLTKGNAWLRGVAYHQVNYWQTELNHG